jgi:hypothetical protein
MIWHHLEFSDREKSADKIRQCLLDCRRFIGQGERRLILSCESINLADLAIEYRNSRSDENET